MTRAPAPSRPGPPPRRRRLGPAVLLAVVLWVGVAGGCVPTGERPELVDDPAEADGPAPVECPPPGERFAAFTVQPVTVRTAEGSLVRCVLVADTVELRRLGLSGVPDLDGHVGMVFAFAEDSTGSFWMGDTHVPLTIAFIDGTGSPVTVLDMEPCPEAVDCPSYFPDRPYRWALEVPRGTLADFGLGQGATLDPATLPPAAG